MVGFSTIFCFKILLVRVFNKFSCVFFYKNYKRKRNSNIEFRKRITFIKFLRVRFGRIRKKYQVRSNHHVILLDYSCVRVMEP